MSTVRRLAVASTIATFVLVGIGGLVRATKSGLGCGTDWPDCAGDVIPFFGSRAVVIEFSHRLMASVVVILLGVLAVTAWRHRHESRRLMVTALIAFALVLSQALIGALVVMLELKAESVVLHLATAMTLLGVLIYLTAHASVADGSFEPTVDRDTSRRARMAAGAVFVLLLVGSYVTGRGAGYVFDDWPLMGGRLIPDLAFEPAAVHFLHRVLAAVTGVIVFTVGLGVLRRRDRLPVPARFAHVAMGLYALQVLIGAANVWNPPPGVVNELLVTAHLLTAAFIWAALVAMSVTSSESLRQARSEGWVGAGAYEASV